VFSLNLRPGTGPYLRDCVERRVPMATSCPTHGMQPWLSSPAASGLPLIETTRASQAYDGVFHPDGGAEDAIERNIPSIDRTVVVTSCGGLCLYRKKIPAVHRGMQRARRLTARLVSTLQDRNETKDLFSWHASTIMGPLTVLA
jgi:hypothetical protein